MEQVHGFQVNGPDCYLMFLSIHAKSDQVAAELLVGAASYAYDQGDRELGVTSIGTVWELLSFLFCCNQLLPERLLK